MKARKGHRWGIVNLKVDGSLTICCVRAATISEAEAIAAEATGLPVGHLCAHRLAGNSKRRAGRFG